MMSWKMLVEAKKVAPILFENAGPGCYRGPCPEGSYACGKPYKEGEVPSDEELIIESMKPSD